MFRATRRMTRRRRITVTDFRSFASFFFISPLLYVTSLNYFHLHSDCLTRFCIYIFFQFIKEYSTSDPQSPIVIAPFFRGRKRGNNSSHTKSRESVLREGREERGKEYKPKGKNLIIIMQELSSCERASLLSVLNVYRSNVILGLLRFRLSWFRWLSFRLLSGNRFSVTH